MSTQPAWFLGFVFCLTCIPLSAADDEAPRKLEVDAITGEFAGTSVDFCEKYKDRTQVVLFIAASKFDRPIGRYMKKLDAELAKGIEEAPQAVATAVWLTDDVGKSKEYLPKADQSLMFSKTALTVFPGEQSGPTGWNVDVASTLTVVVMRDGKEVARFAYVSTNDQDVPEVLKALKQKP